MSSPQAAGATPAQPANKAAAPAQKPAPKMVEVERKIQPIEAARIKSGDFVRAQYVATAFDNTNPEDLTRSDYWAHFAGQLKPRDRIEVWANDASWVADVVVMLATKNAADVRVLRVDYIERFEPSGDAPEGMASYEVRYRGLHSQWSVVRKADNAMVHEGSGSRMAAQTWLQNHLKAFK